jgi:RNA polymerase sigma factor (sigma-70 family)
MTSKELNTIFHHWYGTPNEDTRNSLLQACLAFTRRHMSKYRSLQADHEDVAQEVLMTVHGSLETLTENGSFAAWLRLVTSRRCIDFERARARAKEISFTENHFAVDEEAPNFNHEQLRVATQDNYPIYQELLRGSSVATTATKLGLSRNAVELRMKRIRDKAKKNG